jgi:hypothetical protein
MCISQSPFRKDILNWFLQLKGLQFLGMIHSMWKLDTTWFEYSFFFHVYSCLTYIKQGFYLILKKKSNIFVRFLQAEVSTLALKWHIFLYRSETLHYSRNGNSFKGRHLQCLLTILSIQHFKLEYSFSTSRNAE